MALLTLLPIGMLQLQAAIEHGYWYARSAEFMQQPIIELLVWMRVPGDTIFSDRRAVAGLVRVAAVDRSRDATPTAGGRRADGVGGAKGASHVAAIDHARSCLILRRPAPPAPHRLMFFIGASNVLLAMAWWTAMAGRCRAGSGAALPTPSIPAGWVHAFVMQYQVLPPFMFGFLLTVFPRWMDLPALTRWHYLPVGIGLFGGQLLTLAGAVRDSPLAGLAGPGADAGRLARRLSFAGRPAVAREAGTTWHAIACAVAACRWASSACCWPSPGCTAGDGRTGCSPAIKFGSFGLLLPMYFTVAHRMFPFFAGVVVPGYQAWRPMWLLAAFWPLCLVHLGLELVHALRLAVAGRCCRWLALDGAGCCWRWWPRRPVRRPCCACCSSARLAAAGAARCTPAQSLWFAATGEFIAGPGAGACAVHRLLRQPAGGDGDAGDAGSFGTAAASLAAAPRFAFVAIQLVAVMRIVAELAPRRPRLAAVAAALAGCSRSCPGCCARPHLPDAARSTARPG